MAETEAKLKQTHRERERKIREGKLEEEKNWKKRGNC